MASRLTSMTMTQQDAARMTTSTAMVTVRGASTASL
jgi:hypothetical protein